MNKNLIIFIISLLLLSIYILVDFFMQRKELFPEDNLSFKMKSIEIIDISFLIKNQLEDNDISILSEWELWRYPKPEIKEEKKEDKKEKKYIRYTITKEGNREYIVNPENPNEIWGFYGVFLVNKKSFAIFYNPEKNEYKIVVEKDRLTDNLIVDKITSSKIIVKFPVSEKKYEKLELKVFFVDLEQFKKKLEKEFKNGR
ncbi:MAG: hypothetical protein GXO21_06525 [Aquificae bacterium]|nr:hypothetical protein [Aquificota bacterium]